MFGLTAVVGVILNNYGGWVSLDPETYNSPQFFQTLSAKQQVIWWQLGFLCGSYPFLPVTISRVYAAKDLKSLRLGAIATVIGPYLATISSVFIGTMGVMILGEACTEVGENVFGQDCGIAENKGSCNCPPSPFASIINQLMLLGGFPRFAGVMLYTSSLAAIMSTTDSVLIAISQMITADVVYPLFPKASPSKVAWFGRFVSFVVSVIGLVFTLGYKG